MNHCSAHFIEVLIHFHQKQESQREGIQNTKRFKGASHSNSVPFIVEVESLLATLSLCSGALLRHDLKK